MTTARTLRWGIGAAVAALLVACAAQMGESGTDPAIRIGESDLGGVVTSANGPEAGVWVRGYGLVDSPKVRSEPPTR